MGKIVPQLSYKQDLWLAVNLRKNRFPAQKVERLFAASEK
jgi:hypothetical protein